MSDVPVTSMPTPGDAALEELRQALARVRSYARALEQRCDRLWTYVPDTHGQHDPAVPFVATACDVTAVDLDPAKSRA